MPSIVRYPASGERDLAIDSATASCRVGTDAARVQPIPNLGHLPDSQSLERTLARRLAGSPVAERRQSLPALPDRFDGPPLVAEIKIQSRARSEEKARRRQMIGGATNTRRSTARGLPEGREGTQSDDLPAHPSCKSRRWEPLFDGGPSERTSCRVRQVPAALPPRGPRDLLPCEMSCCDTETARWS